MLNEIGGSWEAATVTGVLRQEGWGAALGYPGIELDGQGDEIQGLLFSSEKFAGHWARLDAFEGDSYERLLTAVKLKGNRTVDAFIYALKD